MAEALTLIDLVANETNSVPPIDPSSNRVANESYDVAGNMRTGQGQRAVYAFDAAGMMSYIKTLKGQQKRMIYTADDERIGTEVDQSTGHWTIRDLNSAQVVREFQGAGSADPWSWEEDWIYSEGQLVGGERMPDNGGKRHFSLDHLGTVRMITNDQRMRYGRHDFYPFGREQTVSVQEPLNFGAASQYGLMRTEPMKFTSHERDFNGALNVENTDYLDYMHARYYSPVMGRFLSVDHGASTRVTTPQTWNKFSYARNNPLSRIDRNGLEDKLSSIRPMAFGTLLSPKIKCACWKKLRERPQRWSITPLTRRSSAVQDELTRQEPTC
jgi:RHS repeat-associated protein